MPPHSIDGQHAAVAFFFVFIIQGVELHFLPVFFILKKMTALDPLRSYSTPNMVSIQKKEAKIP